ncbi:MAG: nuclear transport factor 2 family protein [Bacteroidia bacterium]|nr:nuclear transport factor 2 family protein [Bacteroidia bacterium]
MTASSNLLSTQAAYQGFAEGNLEPIFSILDEQTIWNSHSSEDSPMKGIYKGPQGVQEYFGNLPKIELERFELVSLAEKDHVVFVLLDTKRRIKSSGKTTEGYSTHVLQFEEGKLKRMDLYEPLN